MIRSLTLSEVLEATEADFLNGTILQSIPTDGVLTVECSANVAVAAAHADLRIQLPDGHVPIGNQVVPANGYDTTNGVLHDDTEVLYTFDANEGGHFSISVTLTGSVTYMLRATLVWDTEPTPEEVALANVAASAGA